MKRKECWPDREQVGKHCHRAVARSASDSPEVELPLEVVWLVLQFLGVEDLLRAQLVCVAWRDLIHSEKSASLWKRAYFVTWPLPQRGPPPEPDDDKEEEKYPPSSDPPKWRSVARWRLARHFENDPNHQVTRLARQLTDQLQQVPDVEPDEESTKREGNPQVEWLKRLLKRTSDHATLLESVASVRRQLHRLLARVHKGREEESTGAAVRAIASLLPNIYWSRLSSREWYYEKDCIAESRHYKRFVCHRAKAVIYSVASGLPLQLTLTFNETKRSLKIMPYVRYKAKDGSPRPGVSRATSPEHYRSLLANMTTYLLGVRCDPVDASSVLVAHFDGLVRLVLRADEVPKLYSLGDTSSKLKLKSPWLLGDDVTNSLE